ncbi:MULTISPECIES: hypothetical protein [Hyphomonas]|uniref:hypothetical protein n=1 Tax=Hyphomonas TaxID=85 RepID=UPI003516477F
MRSFFVAAGMAVVASLLPAAHAQDIPMAGWTVKVSPNSVYLTRPDLPGINIGIVSDVRPDLTQQEKFEYVKGFFAGRAACPSLASAETVTSFAGFSAKSGGPVARCTLISMGHWEEGGLQSALILDELVEENKILGGVPAGPTAMSVTALSEKIQQEVTEYLMGRYQVAEAGMTADQVRAAMSAQGLAKRVSPDRKPVGMVRMIDSGGFDAVTHAGEEETQTLLLFPKRPKDFAASAITCMNWDAALFDPYYYESPWKVALGCDRYFWRGSADDLDLKDLDARMGWSGASLKLGKFTFWKAETYRKFAKGAALDVRIGIGRSHFDDVLAGNRSLSEMQPRDILFLPDGRFMAGHVRASSLAGGGTEGPVAGQYYFDGHVVTLLLDSGEVVYGHAGWFPGAGSSGLDHKAVVNINGWVYTSYCRDEWDNC